MRDWVYSKLTVAGQDADKFARSEFEQRSWSTGQTSRMKFVIEPTGMYLRRVGVSEPSSDTQGYPLLC